MGQVLLGAGIKKYSEPVPTFPSTDLVHMLRWLIKIDQNQSFQLHLLQQQNC